MSNRLGFRAFLQKHTDIPKLYFQSPANVRMTYPCLRYELSRANTAHADNVPYRITPVYELTLIDPDPDSKYVYQLMALPQTRFDRYYRADNLNHWVFRTHYTGIFPDADQ